MSAARIKRAARIVELREGVVDRVEVELAQRLRDTAKADADTQAARQKWEAAVAAPPPARCSSGELSESYAYRLALVRAVEMMEARAKEARAGEDAVREKLRAAKTELRKIETWRDRLVETLQADEATKERKAADDIAARIARSA